MNFKIKKLTADMADDYIDFFENRGFHSDTLNRGCYCVWHHWTDKHEKDRAKLPKNQQAFVKRDYARQLIIDRKLNGFVAIYEGKIAGFCNADFKENYARLNKENSPDLWTDISQDAKILSIVCYVVDIQLRSKGIATSLLQGICEYALKNNFEYVEAYPSLEKFNSTHCTVPFSIYEKQGFTLTVNNNTAIARKKLTKEI